MNDEERKAAVMLAASHATDYSIAYVEAAALPERIVLTEHSFVGIGKRAEELASTLFRQLQTDCGDTLPEVTALAVRTSLTAVSSATGYLNGYIDAGLAGPGALKLTVEGLTDSEGLAATTYDYVHGAETFGEEKLFRKVAKFDFDLITVIVMETLSLYWFANASAAASSGNISAAFDALGEAFDALRLANFDHGWDQGLHEEEQKRRRAAEGDAETLRPTPSFARMGSDARHRENRAMREQVFSWLDHNMAMFSSMDAAASAIAGVVVPVTWRTARDWVAKWKKLRSAGKPEGIPA